MINKYILRIFLLMLFALSLFIFNCDTGVESSPNAGILRITLQSDPTDNSIVVTGDTLVASEEDIFEVTVFQGRAFQDSLFALLFNDVESSRQQDVIYNIIERENGEYKEFILFESFVPPGRYDKIQFGLTGNIVRIDNLQIPVRLPEGEELLIDIFIDFTVEEDKVTEITLQISPFKSLERFRDVYLFTRDIQVVDLTTLNF